jgi:hypothetical protein
MAEPSSWVAPDPASAGGYAGRKLQCLAWSNQVELHKRRQVNYPLGGLMISSPHKSSVKPTGDINVY